MAQPVAANAVKRAGSSRQGERGEAGQKHRMKLFVRTIGIARARVKIGITNLAYNVTRLAWLEARAMPA